MVKFEIRPVVRRNNKNLRATEGLLNLLGKIIPAYYEYYICVEFDNTGKPRFTKRRFVNSIGWESIDLI